MMEFFGDVLDWFTESGRWLGDDGIIPLGVEHLWLTIVPMMIALVATLPLAVWMGHRRIGQFWANAVVNVGRAVPSFGLLVLAFVVIAQTELSIEFWPAVIALIALAIPPIFTNSYTAIASIDPATVEAARGMGLTDREVLWGIEVPMGTPVILAGVRISLIQVLATVPLAAVVGPTGGYGQYVVRGFAQGRAGVVEAFSGALLIAILTLAVDRLYTVAERRLLPDGVKRLADADVRAAASVG